MTHFVSLHGLYVTTGTYQILGQHNSFSTIVSVGLVDMAENPKVVLVGFIYPFVDIHELWLVADRLKVIIRARQGFGPTINEFWKVWGTQLCTAGTPTAMCHPYPFLQKTCIFYCVDCSPKTGCSELPGNIFIRGEDQWIWAELHGRHQRR